MYACTFAADVFFEWMHEASTQDHEIHRWAEEEFGQAQLKDRRRTRRLVAIAASRAGQPTASLPKSCGRWASAKAAYRFFAHAGLKPSAVLAPHQQQTRQRCLKQPVVLVVQDTTGLNYGHRAGLGLVGTGRDAARGLWLHSSVAFTPQEQALGLVQVECWQRDVAGFGKAAQRHRRAQRDKESQRWLNSFAQTVQWAQNSGATRWINVADREADFYGLFASAAAHPEVGVLVRARHNRRTSEGVDLEKTLRACPAAGVAELSVPRRPGVAAHWVGLEVKFCPVQIQAPQRRGGPDLKLWVIQARQIVSAGQPIEWRLLTNLPVEDLATAVQMIEWYRLRWQIEEYHRVLKSGCHVEDRQLETAQRLMNSLMVDLVVAWRVLALSRASRSDEAKLQEYLTEEELTVLQMYRKQNKKSGPLTLREAVRTIAGLGGFLGRKSDGEPGAMTLWRGLEMLHQLVLGWRLAKNCG